MSIRAKIGLSILRLLKHVAKRSPKPSRVCKIGLVLELIIIAACVWSALVVGPELIVLVMREIALKFVILNFFDKQELFFRFEKIHQLI